MENTTSVQFNNQQLNIDKFVKTMRPFRSKYGLKVKGPQDWITKHEYLTNRIIKSHFYDRNIIGMFGTMQTDLIIFDIDDHNENKILNNQGTPLKILNAFKMITELFGTPSRVFRSSHSLSIHVHYYFKDFLFWEAMQEGAKNKIIRKLGRFPKSIDLFPRPRKPIRFPMSKKGGGLLLDKYTLQPIKDMTLQEILDSSSEVERIHYAEFIDDQDARIYNTAKTRLKQIENIKAQGSVFQIEKYLFPIVLNTGTLNDKIKKLGPAYCKANFPIEVATKRIYDNMPGTGSEKNMARIENRLRYAYDYWNTRKAKTDQQRKLYKREIQLDLFSENAIKKIVKESPFHGQSHKGLTKLLRNAYNWKAKIEGLTKDEVYEWNYTHKYFFYNTQRRGLIPVPQTLLRKWNQRYFKFMPYLEKIGLIVRQQNYSTELSVCNYFNIKPLY